MKLNASLLPQHLDHLKLPFIQEHYAALAQQCAQQHENHVEYLRRLIEGEYTQRRQRVIERRVKAARFPVLKTLEQFRWDWPKKINRLQVQNLFRLEFVAQKANVVLLGTVGLGKTHLATALGYAACQEGYAVLFADAISVINDLSAAHKRGLLRWGGRGGGGAKDCTLYDCTVTGNSGGGADGTLHNCLVTGNEGGSGGNLYGCTVVGNNGGVSGTVFNSIVYYNTGGNYGEGTTLNFSCTTPLPTNGVGNITGPPLFMDMTAGNFWLRDESPCIDTGANLVGMPIVPVVNPDTGETSFVPYTYDPTDILGNTRFIDGNGDGTVAWDIGAYEFDPRTLRFGAALQLTSNGLTFTVKGEPGKTIRIERSRNLLDWEHVATVPILTGGQTLVDPVATSEPFLFYRAMVP